MSPRSKFGILFFLFTIALVIVPTDAPGGELKLVLPRAQ
jgi:hypothetical protein